MGRKGCRGCKKGCRTGLRLPCCMRGCQAESKPKRGRRVINWCWMKAKLWSWVNEASHDERRKEDDAGEVREDVVADSWSLRPSARVAALNKQSAFLVAPLSVQLFSPASTSIPPTDVHATSRYISIFLFLRRRYHDQVKNRYFEASCL